MGVENKKNASLTVRIECKIKENLKKLAKKKGLTISELVNSLITEHLERENYKNQYEDHIEKRSGLMEEKIKKLKEKMKW
ncbi:MAG: hypothetical protein ACRDDY_09340 [Clostridium sp.]|uniref:hypothetical protein n=1 Tax=Clostridium sp. TaxID=1506 RepID=UPI003EE6E611